MATINPRVEKKQFVSVTIRISGEFHHSFQRAEKRNLRAALAIRLIIVRNTSGFIAEDVNSYKNFHLKFFKNPQC